MNNINQFIQGVKVTAAEAKQSVEKFVSSRFGASPESKMVKETMTKDMAAMSTAFPTRSRAPEVAEGATRGFFSGAVIGAVVGASPFIAFWRATKILDKQDKEVGIEKEIVAKLVGTEPENLRKYDSEKNENKKLIVGAGFALFALDLITWITIAPVRLIGIGVVAGLGALIAAVSRGASEPFEGPKYNKISENEFKAQYESYQKSLESEKETSSKQIKEFATSSKLMELSPSGREDFYKLVDKLIDGHEKANARMNEVADEKNIKPDNLEKCNQLNQEIIEELKSIQR